MHAVQSFFFGACALCYLSCAGNDPNSTASVLPSDEQIIAWGKELLNVA